MRRPAPENTVLLIGKVRRRLNLLFTEALRETAVTPRQYSVLIRLFRSDGMSLDELVTALCTDQSSLSRVLDRMVRSGLVRRKVDRDDRRARRFYLTDQSRALEPSVEAVMSGLNRRLLAGFAPGDAARLSADLERLLVNLEGAGT